jgi:hypothetical protein
MAFGGVYKKHKWDASGIACCDRSITCIKSKGEMAKEDTTGWLG